MNEQYRDRAFGQHPLGGATKGRLEETRAAERAHHHIGRRAEHRFGHDQRARAIPQPLFAADCRMDAVARQIGGGILQRHVERSVVSVEQRHRPRELEQRNRRPHRGRGMAGSVPGDDRVAAEIERARFLGHRENRKTTFHDQVAGEIEHVGIGGLVVEPAIDDDQVGERSRSADTRSGVPIHVDPVVRNAFAANPCLDPGTVGRLVALFLLRQLDAGIRGNIFVAEQRVHRHVEAGQVSLDRPRDIERDLQPRFLPAIVVRQYQNVLHPGLHSQGNGERLRRGWPPKNPDSYVLTPRG